MVPFQKYAKFYNLFYQDKDYQSECDFLEKIFKKYAKEKLPKTILDLGCGTGGHALILAQRGYEVTGIDLSSQMLKIAKKKAKKQNKIIDFVEGDIRKIDLKKTFDAAISMFAVMSYLTKDRDVVSVLKKTAIHLKPKGIFVFDCWSGPAVLKIRPEKRIKIFKQNKKTIERLAQPSLDLSTHTVDISFKVRKKIGGKLLEQFSESHEMRFFFPQEIEYFLKVAGFKLEEFCPFMELGKIPSENDWNITVVAQNL